jgi:hypothetical protein
MQKFTMSLELKMKSMTFYLDTIKTYIIKEAKVKNILSKNQTEQILARLTIPAGKRFSPEEVQNLLELESLPAPLPPKKKAESKAKTGKRNIKNNFRREKSKITSNFFL